MRDYPYRCASDRPRKCSLFPGDSWEFGQRKRLAAQTSATPRSHLLVADMPIGKKSILTHRLCLSRGVLETPISALDTTSHEKELPLCRVFDGRYWARTSDHPAGEVFVLPQTAGMSTTSKAFSSTQSIASGVRKLLARRSASRSSLVRDVDSRAAAAIALTDSPAARAATSASLNRCSTASRSRNGRGSRGRRGGCRGQLPSAGGFYG
jgi:hypothetical protein